MNKENWISKYFLQKAVKNGYLKLDEVGFLMLVLSFGKNTFICDEIMGISKEVGKRLRKNLTEKGFISSIKTIPYKGTLYTLNMELIEKVCWEGYQKEGKPVKAEEKKTISYEEILNENFNEEQIEWIENMDKQIHGMKQVILPYYTGNRIPEFKERFFKKEHIGGYGL